jgi:hypothetical protein
LFDPFVTVATYPSVIEAQLARNLLEAEGIEAVLLGEVNAFAEFTALGDQIRLQVRGPDARRAVSVLAAAAAEATLDDNWEDEAEAGLWACSVCGAAVSSEESVCRSCHTPRDAIRGEGPAPDVAVQPSPGPGRSGEGIQRREQIRPTASGAPRLPGADEAEPAAPRTPAGCLTLLALAGAVPLWLLFT